MRVRVLGNNAVREKIYIENIIGIRYEGRPGDVNTKL